MMLVAVLLLLSAQVYAPAGSIECGKFPVLTRAETGVATRARFDEISKDWDRKTLELVRAGSDGSPFDLPQYELLLDLGAESVPLVMEQVRLGGASMTKYVVLLEELLKTQFGARRDDTLWHNPAHRRAVDYWLEVLRTCKPDRYPRKANAVKARAQDILERMRRGRFLIPWKTLGHTGGERFVLSNGRAVSRAELMAQAVMLSDLGPHAVPFLTEALPRERDRALRVVVVEALVQITLQERSHMPYESTTVKGRAEIYRRSIEKWEAWYEDWLECQAERAVEARKGDDSP